MLEICRNKEGIVDDLIQGSDEWLELRKGKITGTRAHTVLVNGKGLDTLIDTLVIELISESSGISFKSAAMQRGNDLEPLAREAFEVAEIDFREVFEVGSIIHPKISEFMISPDGLFEKYGSLEIKCFEAKNYYEHLKAFKADPVNFTFLEKQYITQVQSGLACTGNDFAKGVIFNPDFIGNEYIEFTIERDDKLISELEEKVEAALEKRDQLIKQFR